MGLLKKAKKKTGGLAGGGGKGGAGGGGKGASAYGVPEIGKTYKESEAQVSADTKSREERRSRLRQQAMSAIDRTSKG